MKEISAVREEEYQKKQCKGKVIYMKQENRKCKEILKDYSIKTTYKYKVFAYLKQHNV